MSDREERLHERISGTSGDPDALRELALLIGRARDRKLEAVEVWRRYVDVVDSDDLPGALLALGRAQIEARREADAIETLRRCTREAPDLPEAYETLGELLRRNGDPGAAAAAFRKAAELRPGNAQPLLALLTCLDEMGESSAAGEVLSAVQEIASGDPAVAALLRELMQRRS